jgi:hypothetical protein
MTPDLLFSHYPEALRPRPKSDLRFLIEHTSGRRRAKPAKGGARGVQRMSVDFFPPRSS